MKPPTQPQQHMSRSIFGNFGLFHVLFLAVCVGFAAVAGDEDAGTEQLHVEIVEKPDRCDATSQKGNILKMHYTGTLLDGGTQFDSSRDSGDPFTFQLGAGQVIKGWDQGLIDMCVGEKRKLTIPSHLGYGDQGTGDKIPGGATLVFDVELMEIQDQKPQNVFNEIDLDNDSLLSQDEVSVYIRKQEDEQGLDKTDEESHNAMITDIFLHEDKDKDGFISHEEFTGPKHDEL